MFGPDLNLRDVLSWCDMNSIESADSRSDYGFFVMRMNQAVKKSRA